MTARNRPRHRPASNAPTSAACIVVVVASLLGEGRAEAQSAEAQALFNDGNRLMAAGRFAQACEAFEASNRAEPRAGTLILLGQCRERTQQLASAWSAYQDAVARAKNPSYLRLAQDRVTALEPRLSYLTVRVSADSTLDGLTITRDGKPFDALLWNRALPVDGGDHVISVRAPGHEEWQTTVHVPVEAARLSVELPRLEESRTPAPPGASTPPGPVRPPEPTAAADRALRALEPDDRQDALGAPRPARELLPLVVGSGALALLGGGLGLELWADSKYGAAKSELTSQSRRDSLYDSANTRRYAAEALAAGGFAAGGIAVWLYLRDRGRLRDAVTGARTRIIPTRAGLALSGQF